MTLRKFIAALRAASQAGPADLWTPGPLDPIFVEVDARQAEADRKRPTLRSAVVAHGSCACVCAAAFATLCLWVS